MRSFRDVAVQFGFRQGMSAPLPTTIIELKFCESCGRLFSRHFKMAFDEGLGRHRRVGVVDCPKCIKVDVDRREVEAELHAIALDAKESRMRYRRSGAPLMLTSKEPRHKPRKRWAAWRETLLKKMSANPNGMTREEIGKIYGNSGPWIIPEIRHAGIPLVRIGWTKGPIGGRMRGYALYGLREVTR